MPNPPAAFSAPARIARELSGVTMLLVEDSRFCSEAIRLMAIRTGMRLRRADRLDSALRHLRIYRPDVILVDLGLPDGSGLELIRRVRGAGENGPAIIAMSGEDGAGAEAAARAAGADAFLRKPLEDIALFRETVASLLEIEAPRADAEELSVLELDHRALVEDLQRVRALIEEAAPRQDHETLEYCAKFIGSVAQTANDGDLRAAARRFFRRLRESDEPSRERAGVNEILEAVQSRMARARVKGTGVA